MLLDRIIIGVQSTELCEKLLTEENLTLDRAVNIGKLSEMATTQIRDIKSGVDSRSPAVDFVK